MICTQAVARTPGVRKIRHSTACGGENSHERVGREMGELSSAW
jgi:hypothetical protein